MSPGDRGFIGVTGATQLYGWSGRCGSRALVSAYQGMKALALLVAGCLTFCSTLLVKASTVDTPAARHEPDAAAVSRGFRAFFDRKLEDLGGNGRACADCHMPTDNFQLSPASVEARFKLLQLQRRFNPGADDPLFRAIDADDFRTNGDSASDFSNLRQNGLIRITLPLPPTMRLIDPATNAASDEKFVDVWRSVPTVNDFSLTVPDDGI